MQPQQNQVTLYADRLATLWERMVRTVGIHTVNVLVERAILETATIHPELALIQRTDEGLVFDDIVQAYAGQPEVKVAAAFNDLNAELSLILARQLGREMAQRLAEELSVQAG